MYNYSILVIIITSWPFGPALSVLRCVRCFGAVSVLVQSVYRCGWYLRSLRDCRSPAFVRLHQNIRGSMISNVPKHRLCQNINSVKPLTATKYWPCQNINHAILCSSLFLFPRDKSFKLLFVKFHQKIKKKLQLKAYLNWFAPLARLHARTSIELES